MNSFQYEKVCQIKDCTTIKKEEEKKHLYVGYGNNSELIDGIIFNFLKKFFFILKIRNSWWVGTIVEKIIFIAIKNWITLN